MPVIRVVKAEDVLNSLAEQAQPLDRSRNVPAIVIVFGVLEIQVKIFTTSRKRRSPIRSPIREIYDYRVGIRICKLVVEIHDCLDGIIENSMCFIMRLIGKIRHVKLN